jgi:hypothetical protein
MRAAADLPVLQQYPQGLDALNEDTIGSGHAAERMLMQNAEAIDGRLLSFTSRLRREPSSAVEMRATMDWLVLQRGPNRCGATTRPYDPRRLG